MNLRAEINQPKLWIDIKVQTPEGVTLQELSEEGHSWVRNFYNLYATFMVDSSVLGTGLDVFDDANVKSGSGTPREYAGNTFTTGWHHNDHFWVGVDGIGDGNGIVFTFSIYLCKFVESLLGVLFY